jgi:phage baseplate assembly protein W
MQKPDIYGQGLSFPPRVGADGRLAWSSGEENVRESIRLILMTEPGERLMRAGFGCGLRSFLFEPNTPTTRALIRDRITRAVGEWEPRVQLDAVNVDSDPSDERAVNVLIIFRLVSTGNIGRVGMTLQLEG